MENQKVIVLDFGGQYNQLIARRVRECSVYCEVLPYTTPLEKLKAENPIGIIFTGGPNSVYLESSPHYDPGIFEMGVPILGICYGCQLMAYTLGGEVTEAQDDSAREYGKTETWVDTGCKLFKGLPEKGITWMSHGDYMAKVPEGFTLTAHLINGFNPSTYVEFSFINCLYSNIFPIIGSSLFSFSKTSTSVEYPFFVFLITGNCIFSKRISPNCFVELILNSSPAIS